MECKDVACASLSVCLLVTTVSPTKTDEPIEVPFGLWTRVGPRNRVFPGEGAILGLFPHRNALDCISSKRRRSTGLSDLSAEHQGHCAASEWTGVTSARRCSLSSHFWPLVSFYVMHGISNFDLHHWALTFLIVLNCVASLATVSCRLKSYFIGLWRRRAWKIYTNVEIVDFMRPSSLYLIPRTVCRPHPDAVRMAIEYDRTRGATSIDSRRNDGQRSRPR